MKNKKEVNNQSDAQTEFQPYRVRLPGFIRDEEIGLGDVIKQVTYFVGIEPCGGCNQRAAILNRWMVFSNKRSG